MDDWIPNEKSTYGNRKGFGNQDEENALFIKIVR